MTDDDVATIDRTEGIMDVALEGIVNEIAQAYHENGLFIAVRMEHDGRILLRGDSKELGTIIWCSIARQTVLISPINHEDKYPDLADTIQKRIRDFDWTQWIQAIDE